MVRTMIYLENESHRKLKHLAVERHTSLTALIREAVNVLYQEDMEDLRIGRQRLEDYLHHPEQSIPYAEYRRVRREKG